MSGTWGWTSGRKNNNCLEERIWFNRNADETLYEGMIPGASGEAGSSGKPDGLLWAGGTGDWRTRRLLGIVELKAVPSDIDAAVKQLRTYSSGLLLNAKQHNISLTQVIGVAVAGNNALSALEIKVLKFYLDDDGVF